jgi:hypothetical protein
MAGVKVKVYVITDSASRQNDHGQFKLTMAYEESSRSIKTVTFPIKFESQIEKGKYYIILKVAAVNDVLRLNDMSRVCIKNAV